MSAGGADSEQTYIQALALGVAPEWRRRTDDERRDDGCALAAAVDLLADAGGRTIAYSSIGLEAGVDLLLVRMEPTVDDLE